MELFKKFKKSQDDKINLRIVQNEFTQAKSNYDISVMDERELLYLGTHSVDANVNDSRSNISGRKKANNVVNIIYELIESQVDANIPQPLITSKRPLYEDQARMIEDSIRNDLLESDIYSINDENERTTPIQGFSIVTVEWDPDFKHHLYRGEIKLRNRHPKTLIPQPGVFKVQDMDYFFLMYSETRDYVNRRFGIDLELESEQYPEINSIDGNSDNLDNQSNKITVITKWYKDKEGKIGKFTWCNDSILEDFPNYYANRTRTCKKCKAIMNSQKCECGNTTYTETIEEYETLENDIYKMDGSVIPAMSPVMDEMGNPVLDMFGQPTVEPTKIKYFSPNRYPIVIRKNVPVAFNFGGQSDIDVIRDQADAVKKVVSIIEEKIIRGGTIVKALRDHKFELTNELYKVIRGDPQELANLSILNVGANIQNDLIFVTEQYKSAQNTLGITNSYQGKPDTTAKSGVAKQIQINQSSGRLQSKIFNKRLAYKELFEIMFDFKLAFYDQLRSFVKKDENGKPEWGVFSKYEFLEQDAAGEWYYNTDFLFSADAGEGIPKDKVWLMTQATNYAQMGLLNKVQFWQLMEKLGYPGASDIKKQAEQEAAMQQQAAMMPQQMQQQAPKLE